MKILALLPDDSARALQRALGSSGTVIRVADAGALVRATATTSAHAVVIDPTRLSDAEWANGRVMLQQSRVPVLLYATLAPETIHRVVAASALGVHEVLLRHIDDDSEAILRRLQTIGAPPPPARVLAMLAPRLSHLPESLQGAAVPLFCAGRIPRWADDLARATKLPRRTVDRCVERAGLAGTARLLDVARLARIWLPLVDGNATQLEVATRGGYRRVRMLASHCKRIAGAAPSHLGARMGLDKFVAQLAQHAMRGPG